MIRARSKLATVRAACPVAANYRRRFDDLGVLRIARAFEAMRAFEARPWPEPPKA